MRHRTGRTDVSIGVMLVSLGNAPAASCVVLSVLHIMRLEPGARKSVTLFSVFNELKERHRMSGRNVRTTAITTVLNPIPTVVFKLIPGRRDVKSALKVNGMSARSFAS